jgi:hypothetical protein
MFDSWRLAIGDIAADRSRTLLTIAALVPLIVAFFIVAALAAGIREVAQAAPPDLNLVLVEPDLLDLSVGNIDATIVAAVAEVAGADAVRVTPAMFRILLVDDATLPKESAGLRAKVLQLRAAEVDTWVDQHGLELVAGAFPDRADELVVTKPVVDVTGWQVDSLVDVYGSTFRISGVVEAPGTKSVSLWLDLDRASELFETGDRYQLVYVQLAPGAVAEELERRLVADPRLSRYAVVLESRLALLEREVVAAWGPVFVVPVGMALALIAFGTFNFAAMALEERRREVGVLRALGFSASVVRSVAAVRTVLVALASYGIATAISWTFLRQARTVDVIGAAVSIRLGGGLLLLGVGLTVLVSWIGVRLATHRLLAANVGGLLER